MISLGQTVIVLGPQVGAQFGQFQFGCKRKKRKKKPTFLQKSLELESFRLCAMPKEQKNDLLRQTPIPLILTSGPSSRALKSLTIFFNAFMLLLFSPFHKNRAGIPSMKFPISSEKLKDEKQDRTRKSGEVMEFPSAIFPWWRALQSVTLDQDVAARRAQAICRVMQDNRDENTVRDFRLHVSSRGDTLFTQSWTPVSRTVRGLVLLLHGLNEHSGRYNYFARKLNTSGYKIYAMDWIGHGGSDGLHAYVHSLDAAVDDTKAFMEKIVAENPGLPCFCFGHSTGAMIALKAALDPNVEALLSGLVLTSPAIGVKPSHPIIGALAPLMAMVLPTYQVSAASMKGTVVSRDPEALLAKYSDPLVYTGAIRAKTGYEILRIASLLQGELNLLRAPFFVLHGTADTVTDPRASHKLYVDASSVDKTIRLLDGLFHDLLFEPERDEIIRYILEWLDSRLGE